MRFPEFLGRITSWSLTRMTCFVLLVATTLRAPGWAKGSLWLLTLLIGIWAFQAVVRDSRRALDFLVPATQRGIGALQPTRNPGRTWKIIGLLCAAVIIAVTIFRAWPIWSFKATSSLREDEIMSISRYTSKGFVPAISTYHIARNHILYNILSSLIPGAGSTAPLRARLLSFACVITALTLLIVYSARRGWLLPGLACAGLVAVNFPAMDSLLEARGYGLIFLWAMLGCIAFSEWLRTDNRVWLQLTALCCVLGTYTLPFYIVFGGSLLLLGFVYRPSKETFLAGFLSLVAIAMLYLPIAANVFAVFQEYESRYGPTFITPFRSIDGVFASLQFFIPFELLRIDALAFSLIALVVVLGLGFGRFGIESDRISSVAITVSILAFLAFCLYCKVVPTRVASYLAAPLSFLAVLMIGSILWNKAPVALGSYPQVLFTALALVVLGKSGVSKPIVARADWRSLGVLIERAFPKDTRIWIAGESPGVLQWNLASRAKPESGALDNNALSNGQLLAVEAYTAPDDKDQRLRWDALPTDVRFVTSPLSLNYHRVFFVAPKETGITSIVMNNQPLTVHTPGR
ncbi:MAG TPA: hypothetical protein VIT23_01955, partial [Terrimicrobiaceae bacterium]